MKKRPALLLEVLLAMTLLAFCAVALIRQPLLLHRAELAQLERIEQDRIAAWSYTEIREKLLKGEIPWSKIPPLKTRSASFSLPDAPLDLLPHPLKRTYTLETLREKQTAGGQITRLIAIHIEVGSGRTKRPFSYQINLLK
jgi:hypothetical protein